MFDAITVQTASESANIQTLIYTILLSFVLSVLLAVVYQKTYRGLKYSPNFVQSVVLISIISSVIIQAIGDSLARGLGIMAAMAIIRFRTNLKDPRDTLFLFASLAAGISCGSYAFDIALVGTIGFCLAVVFLYFSPFGASSGEEGTLTFNLPAQGLQEKEKKYLEHFMGQYCKTSALLTMKQASEEKCLNYSYQIKLRKGKSHEELLEQLQRLPSIENLSLRVS